jgi:hypothetical protein
MLVGAAVLLPTTNAWADDVAAACDVVGDAFSCIPDTPLPVVEYAGPATTGTAGSEAGTVENLATSVDPVSPTYVPGSTFIGGIPLQGPIAINASSSGCTSYAPRVCIQVSGQSTHVNNINGTAFDPSYGDTTRGEFYFNGALVAVSQWFWCPAHADFCGSNWPLNRYVANNTQICFQLNGYTGRPCERVYK